MAQVAGTGTGAEPRKKRFGGGESTAALLFPQQQLVPGALLFQQQLPVALTKGPVFVVGHSHMPSVR